MKLSVIVNFFINYFMRRESNKICKIDRFGDGFGVLRNVKALVDDVGKCWKVDEVFGSFV